MSQRFTSASKFAKLKADNDRKTGVITTATRAGQQQVTSYLESNPEFLENYVLNHVDLETLERWTIRKARHIQKGNGIVQRKPSLSKWKFCVHADKRAMLQEMTAHIQIGMQNWII